MLQFNLISLGCAKNLVDSEVMLGSMSNNGWELVESPENADLLLINTCGFIQSAVEEAIEEILELAKIKKQIPGKKLVVTGCLVQRYKEMLVENVALNMGAQGANIFGDRVEVKGDDGQVLFTVQSLDEGMSDFASRPSD